MIGSPLSIGRVSEVVPVAPRADVRAPLVMERLLPLVRSPELLEQTAEVAALARALPAPWQRLVSAELNAVETQLIYERFVGVTLRELSVALRTAGRVLPMDVLRTVVECTGDGLAALEALPARQRPISLSDRSIGLTLDGHWRFALGALNHWLIDLHPTDLISDPEYDATSPDTVFFMSPEAISGRAETPASFATRTALFAWQITTGGLHPYRGGRHEMLASLTRYTRDEVRVPATVHPQMTPGLEEILLRGVSFAGRRFGDLRELRAALDPVWPLPAASAARTLEVIASVTWTALHQELQTLKREPLLPIRWDGVWTAAHTPEQGIAVLEDQLLERLEPIDLLPRRGPFEASFPAPPPAIAEPNAPVTPVATVIPRTGLFQRLLALFRR